jgi:DNA repair protein RadA/Sms
VAQVRECAAQLTRVAKTRGCTMVLVGHVTKEGALAGPRVLEHIVDTVLYFEGDTHSSFRLVRAIKNRFGAVNEIGVFAMTDRGLKGVSNPSAIFLSTHGEPVPGSCVLVTLEGTRPLLVEIQALVDSGGGSPRRLSVGLDRDRLAMLLAVLHRHAGVAAWTRTCSSTPWAACASASRRPTWRCCWPSRAACAARRCRAASSPSARSAWPARCGRRRAARSG